MRVRRLICLIYLILSQVFCRVAVAHPMGNFSVNHYSKITLESDRIRVRYLIDLAEIPTYQELQEANIPATAIDPDSAAVTSYLLKRGEELGRGLILNVDDRPAQLKLVSSEIIFPPGAGGLPTMKMGFVYETVYPATLGVTKLHEINVRYVDNNYTGHSGWKEIIAVSSAGSLLRSTVPEKDRSGELSNYPTDLLSSPPQNLEALLTVTLPAPPAAVPVTREAPSAGAMAVLRSGLKQRVPNEGTRSRTSPEPAGGGPAATPIHLSPNPSVTPSGLRLVANRQATPRNQFTELIQAQSLSGWFLFTAAFIAIGLGGLHALEPGHGKTIVAAYLAGSKGTARHAVLLGIIVTVSHTVGVFILGAITLFASRYIVPEQLYPWLGVLSGVTIAGLGSYMLLRRLTGTATDHSHVPGSSHSHWMFWKRPADERTENDSLQNEAPQQTVSLTQLLTLGITGGIIPCPAALIVLLSAFALHRVGLGFFLIVAFSIGLAGVLVSFGMLMVYARRFMSRLRVDGPMTRRWLPVASAAFITMLGLALAFQAMSSVHMSNHVFWKEQLGPILFVAGLGLVLGMRHSTDADHVVAISTIVSKQQSIRNAAFIGSVWGLGHTITIFVVGSLIILFGVEIPPRLGLSMEFSVAIMLILLGVLNLTGIMQKLTTFFTPASTKADNSPAPVSNSKPGAKIESLFAEAVSKFGLYQCVRPLVIGLVHGLAGSAAVALLVLSTIHNPVWATFYLLIFGAGTMIGMMCMTAAIAAPLTFAGDRFKKLGHYFGIASGMVSLCFGSFLVYQLGFLGGLFTSHPQWTPR